MQETKLWAFILLAWAGLSSCAMIDNYTGENVYRPVRKTGVPASGKILEIWDTGVRLNDNPVVGFRLLVTRDNGSVYEAETRNVISIVHLCQFQPGAVVAVKIDADDPNLVALDVFE